MDLPELFDIIFKNKEREFDRFRWALLEWAVDLDEGTVKKIRGIKNSQRFAAVIVTLMYLVQVCKPVFSINIYIGEAIQPFKMVFISFIFSKKN